VDASLIHLSQISDRPFEFPLDRTCIIDVFGEVRRPQVGSVKKFEAGAARPGESGRRHLQAKFGQVVARHQDRCAVAFLYLVGDAALFKLRYDRPGVLGRNSGKQRRETRVVPPPRK
jgi:hypothetical protein